nr:flavodoxin domain-containing protein [Actinoplanes digitatis]
MTVLVAYGSAGGGTGEIAGWITEELRSAGLNVDLSPGGGVTDVGTYEAVILGSAVYASGWHADARDFTHRFARPVHRSSRLVVQQRAIGHLRRWGGVLPPSHHAELALRVLPAREHGTFGGRMTSEAHGWLGIMARQLAREGHAGDFRNPERIRAWARSVAAELRKEGPAHGTQIEPSRLVPVDPSGPDGAGHRRREP